MQCSKCSFENRDAAKFCENCGVPLARVCPNCGESLSPQAQFCGNCGFDLASPSSASRLSALQPSAPATPQEKIRAIRSESDGERKPVTILFTDVVGSSALAEKLDPEEWKRIISGAHQRVSEAVCRYEGTIAQLLGDGVLAFFGAPVTREDDPVRAVRAALHIQSAIADYACTLKGLVENFQMRIGINTGLVVVGNIGSDQHMEYLAIGDAVNLAARLQSAAPPGQVLLSEATARLVKAAFELKSLGEIALKGKADLVSVFQVVQTKAAPERGHGIEGLTSPLVGRDQAVATFKGNLEQLMAGQGGIVSVIGEAGVGKSRLMAEMRKATVAEQLYWLEGRTLSFGRTISYWPFQEILRRYAGITEEDSEPVTWDKLERAVTALFAETTIEILPYLASLLALEVKGEYAERVKYLDGEAMRHQVFLVSRRFFERLAQTQPVVLIFEDLHWVDESSALLIEHLLPLVERAPLLICGISRPDPETPAARLREMAAKDFASRYTDIRLPPLSETESAQLVRNLVASETFAPQLQELIVRKAEGNPFFLEEIIRSLIDTGIVVRDAATGRWHATAKAETVTIPDTVQGVILARVDRLDEDLRQVLRTAAVIGRSFLYRILRAIAEADRHLDEHLTELQALEFIREKQRMPELEYIFKHALAQEATYESILLQKRRELHAQVGQVIETSFADRLEEFYSLLAYHYARAEVWEKAQEYLLKAADLAGRTAADTEALAHYQQAIAVYARAFGDKWDPVQRATLERKMGESYYSLGRFTESILHMRQAVARLGHPWADTALGLMTGIVGDLTRQVLRRVFPKQFSMTLSQQKEANAGLLEATRAYEGLSEIYYFSNDVFRLICAGFRSLDLAEQVGRSPELARAYATNSMTAGAMPFHPLARYYERRALEIARGMTDLSALAWVLLTTAVYRIGICDWAQCRMVFSEGLKIAKSIGDLRRTDELASALVWVVHYQGDLSGSIERWLEIYASASARKDANIMNWGLCGQVENGLPIKGPTDELLALLLEAETLLATERMDLPAEIRDYGLMARVFLYRGEAGRAKEAAEKAASAIAKTMPTNFWTVEGYAGAAEAFLALWQMAEEQSQVVDLKSDIKNLKSRARQSCRALMGFARVFRAAQPRAWLWQGAYEWQAHKQSAAQSAWEKSITAAQKFAMPYEEGWAHYEIGRRLGDRAHLEQAVAIFAKLGAEWDLARAREALVDVTK